MKRAPKITFFLFIVYCLSFIIFPASAQDTSVSAPASVEEKCVTELKYLEVDGKKPYPQGNPSIILPDCVYFEGTLLEKQCGCRNINVFIQLLIKAANVIFMIVGGVALIMFIYGGFVILTAAGGENVKKGKDIIVAAVIGLVIIFTAQLLMRFLIEKALPQEAVVNGQKKSINSPEIKGLEVKLPEK